MRKGGPGPKLEFAAFSKWCHYVYAYTDEDSTFRKFIFRYFYYASNFTLFHLHIGTLDELHATQYGSGECQSLAHAIPELFRDLFRYTRDAHSDHRQNPTRPFHLSDKAPWDECPCKFHNHTSSPEFATIIEFPRALKHRVDFKTSPVAHRILYYMQINTLQGILACHVAEMSRDLGVGIQEVVGVSRRSFSILDAAHG